MNIHIHAPQATERKLVRTNCPTCKKTRFMAAWFTPWYGWDHTCLKCGESWQDGEMCERPFVRAWRQKSVEDARKRWRAAAPASAQEKESQ